MTKEQQIENYMKSLQISREEAEQLWEDDQEDYIGEEGEQMSQKAKENRRYEQSAEKKVRKPREKKIDEDKVKIISFLQRAMIDSDALNIVIKNEQREITFTYNGAEYSLTLTKHRPPKKQCGLGKSTNLTPEKREDERLSPNGMVHDF